MVSFPRLFRDRTAAAGAEFALVLPLLLIVMFGIIDAGRYMWEVNEMQKAAQMGARYAVVTAPIADGLTTTGFVGVDGLAQGDRIPASELGTITCTSSACTCVGCPAGLPGAYDPQGNFTKLVDRMKGFYPAITAANVTVLYSGSGIGYAGDPNGIQIQPLVTVRLSGVTFQPISTLLFATMNLPSFSTTLTAEDLSGSQSN